MLLITQDKFRQSFSIWAKNVYICIDTYKTYYVAQKELFAEKKKFSHH